MSWRACEVDETHKSTGSVVTFHQHIPKARMILTTRDETITLMGLEATKTPHTRKDSSNNFSNLNPMFMSFLRIVVSKDPIVDSSTCLFDGDKGGDVRIAGEKSSKQFK